ncbi:MAG: YjhX family toxin [Lentilitoribacter sp.]
MACSNGSADSAIPNSRDEPLNISKLEQRALHVLAQGGSIHYTRGENRKITKITCYTREGYVLSDCTFEVFTRLKKRRFIKSKNGAPYRATKLGVSAVLSQLDNR